MLSAACVALCAACAGCDAPARTDADPARGKVALTQHACTACHRVEGVVGPDVHAGPPLTGMRGRAYIAGQLPNTPENMLRWILDPHAVNPATAMPDLDVPLADARDIVAYLYAAD